MEAVTIFLVVLLVVAAAVLAWFVWRRPDRPPPRREAWDAPSTVSGARVVLDLRGADPDDPAVQRLARDAALRALRGEPAVDHVEVVDRDGRRLGHEERPRPLPEVAIPDTLHEPHLPRSRTPSVVPRPDALHAPLPVGDAQDVTVAPLPLADRFALPPAVRDRIRDPDRVSDVVRAILETAGHTVRVDGDLLTTEEVAIAVVDARREPERALTHGFLRIQGTSAPRGIVLRLGHVDPAVVRRREAAAPHVRHVAVDALQRMADAVAVGADPIDFVAGPPVRRR